MILTYKFRLNLTAPQRRRLEKARNDSRVLYNAALEERISAWRNGKKQISYVDQCRSLTEIRRDDPALWGEHAVTLGRWVLRRLDNAFKGFFARVKKGRRPGFPRFRSASRWSSFGFSEFEGIRLQGDRLSIKGVVDRVRVHMHRLIPSEAKFLGAALTEQSGTWFVCLQLRLPDTQPVELVPENAAGADWGVTDSLTVEDGRVFAGVKASPITTASVRKSQRKLARCKRGSRRRKKVACRLAALRRREANQRATRLHQIAAEVVRKTPWVAMEKLQVANMTRSAAGSVETPGTNVKQKSGLNRAILEGCPATLREFVRYKAERAGGGLIEVNPRGTSIECAACGGSVPKLLSERVHRCGCGFVASRDMNAAYVIGKRAFGRSYWIDRHGDVAIPGAPSIGALASMCLETSASHKEGRYATPSQTETSPHVRN